MLRNRIREQSGVAMPLAMGFLLVITLFAAGIAATSQRSNSDAGGDRSAKRALAAAEAGLDHATLRLNAAPPAPGACLVGSPVGGECPTASPDVNLGHGAIARYWVSQRLPAGQTCGAIPAGSGAGNEYCITAVGIVNGEQRRVITRVRDLPLGTPLMPVPGVVGLNSLSFKNNSTIGGHIGSNGTIEIKNNTTVAGVDLGPPPAQLDADGSVTYTQSPTSPVVSPTPFALTPVDPGNSSSVNQNGSISSGGGVTYTPGTRALRLNGATLTLTQGGDYNFCSIVVDNSSSIRLAAGVKARIFVDAPAAVRPGAPPAGSGCGNSSPNGEIDANNNLNLNWPGDPANLQIMVVGWAPGSAYGASNGQCTVDFKNNLNMNGLIYAPHCLVDFKNNAQVNGGVAARDVDFKNNFTFNWDSDADPGIGATTNYTLQGWRECRPQASAAGNPESGC